MVFLGIDPGIEGGIVMLSGDGRLFFESQTPRAGDQMDYARCVAMLTDAHGEWNLPEFATLERVWAWPGQGAKSQGNFLKGAGAWIGILVTLGIPFIEPTPQAWMKMDWLPRRAKVKHDNPHESDKDYAKRKAAAKRQHLAALKLVAEKRWPHVEKFKSGTVSAAFLAEYGRQQQRVV